MPMIRCPVWILVTRFMFEFNNNKFLFFIVFLSAVPQDKRCHKVAYVSRLHDNLPTFVYIYVGKLHDMNVTNYPPPEAEAFYIMNRAYLDFERFYRMHI